MEFRIMTSNVWGDYFGNEVEGRDTKLCGIYEKYSPDILGFQEMTPAWYDSPILKELSKQYAFVGTEIFSTLNFVPLVYKESRFKLLEKGYMPLPQTPDRSKGITWVVLCDNESQKVFAVLNTHFWWKSGVESDLLREKNAAVLTERMQELQKRYGCPVFAFGDLNCIGESAAFKVFSENKIFDLFDFADEKNDVISRHGDPVRGEDGAFHGCVNDERHEKSIDHIIGTGEFKVKAHIVVLDRDALDASDHSPLYADIVI